MSANRKARRANAKKHGLGKLATVMDVMAAETDKYLTEEEYQRLEDYAFEKAKAYIVKGLEKTLPASIAEEMQHLANQVRRVTLAYCAMIIQENGGYLHRLETREEHFYELYAKLDTEHLFNDGKIEQYIEHVNKLQLEPVKIRM